MYKSTFIILPTWDKTFENKNIGKIAKSLSKFCKISIILKCQGSPSPYEKYYLYPQGYDSKKLLRWINDIIQIFFNCSRGATFISYKGYNVNILITFLSFVLPIKLIIKTDSQKIKNSNSFKGKIRNLLMDFSFRNSSLLITETKTLFDHYKSLFPKKNIIVYPNGVDLSQNLDHVKISIKKESFILFTGRLSYLKGIHTLAKIFSLLKNDSIKLVVIGSDSGDGSVKKAKKIFEKNGLNERVLWMKTINNRELLYKYYKEAKITLLTSSDEGLPNRMCESIALGTPVISFDVGLVSQVLNKKIGYVIKPFNLASYAESLDNFLSDSREIKMLSKNCLEFGKNNLDDKKNLFELITKIKNC